MKRTKANTAEIPKCTAYLNTIEVRGLALERKERLQLLQGIVRNYGRRKGGDG